MTARNFMNSHLGDNLLSDHVAAKPTTHWQRHFLSSIILWVSLVSEKHKYDVKHLFLTHAALCKGTMCVHAQITARHYILHCSLAHGSRWDSVLVVQLKWEFQTAGKLENRANSFVKVPSLNKQPYESSKWTEGKWIVCKMCSDNVVCISLSSRKYYNFTS